MMRTLIILPLLLLTFTISNAQTVDLSTLQNKYEVRRISNQPSTIQRPLLSLNTLYSNGQYAKGYYLEYIINHLDSNTNLLNSIFDVAEGQIYPDFPTATSTVDDYSRYLQYQAFRSLLTYVRSQNGQGGGSVPGITHSLAFSEALHTTFLDNLKKPRSFYMVSENPNGVSDYVKWTASLANYARAVDLYLAVERKCNC